jgi:hypothetical protein
MAGWLIGMYMMMFIMIIKTTVAIIKTTVIIIKTTDIMSTTLVEDGWLAYRHVLPVYCNY